MSIPAKRTRRTKAKTPPRTMRGPEGRYDGAQPAPWASCLWRPENPATPPIREAVQVNPFLVEALAELIREHMQPGDDTARGAA